MAVPHNSIRIPGLRGAAVNQKGSDIMKIVNRIITFLAGAAVFPVIIMQAFISIIVSVDKESLVYTLANAFLGEKNQFTGNRIGIEKTVIDFFNYITGKSTGSFDLKGLISNLPAEFEPLKKYVISSLVFVAAGILITVIIMGCALFTRAYKTIIGLGVAGGASFMAALVLFGKAARPLIDGTIDIASTFLPYFVDSESFLGSIAVGALKGAVSVDTCGLGGAVYGAMIIMFAIAVWEFAYYITIPKDEKPRKKVKA